MKTKINRRYGWKPQFPDQRDKKYASIGAFKLTPLPKLVDLRNSCPPIFDQGSLGCHDAETEVLTTDGWTKWNSYNGKTPLATVNQTTQVLEYQQPTKIFAKKYSGLMYGSKNRSLDFCITSNHRMWQRRWDQKKKTLSDKLTFLPIEDCGWYFGLLSAPTGFKGTEVNKVTIGAREYIGKDFIALISLILSDGWVGGTEANKNTLSFCCFRQDRLIFVAALASRLGLHELPGRPGVWKWNDAALADWVRINCYSGSILRSPFKKVPDFIKVISDTQLETFFSFFGDQHKNEENGQHFYSSSTNLIDDLQELLLKTGKRSSIYERDPRTTVMNDGRIIHAENCSKDITLIVREAGKLSIDRKEHLEKGDYSGTIYCAEVPNSTLITRRNGSILISGNSCTANAITGAYEANQIKRVMDSDTTIYPLVERLSRLFIYYNERLEEGTVESDAGAFLRDGIKVIVKKGVCLEFLWPYIIRDFAKEPSYEAYEEALNHQVISYSSVNGKYLEICRALADGYLVVFGFTVYESFEESQIAITGIMPLPAMDESVLGGHAVCFVGYNMDTQMFLVRNSWGVTWGQKGYFWMPFSFLNNCSDFWIIKQVE